MTKLLSVLILTTFAIGAQAASHSGGTPMAPSAAKPAASSASAAMAAASAASAAKKVEMKKEEPKK